LSELIELGRRRLMRCALIVALLTLCGGALVFGKGAARSHPSYRVGKAPRTEFKVGGKSYKIDPEAKSTKQIRALPGEHFDPITRPGRVEKFYRDALREHYEECRREPRFHCGPFRPEFVWWVRYWPARLRARWAWHHRIYIDEILWAQWMADQAFAAEIAFLQQANTPVVIGYLPPEYAATSPVLIYTDEYLDAAYNPVPFLAVLTLKSLKPDAATAWIGTAAVDSMLSKLSSVPGLFVADREQVSGVLREQKLPETDVAEVGRAAQVGKAMDVERVVVGSYVVDGDKVLFNLRIVDVRSGAVENGISKTVPRDHLLDEMPGLATSVATALGYDAQPESAPVPGGGSNGIVATVPSMPAAPPKGGSIFDPPPDAVPPAVLPPIAVPPAAPSTPGVARGARHVYAKGDKITGSMTFTGADGPYEIEDKLEPAEGVKDYTLRFGPGAEIRGGTITFGKSGHVEIEGTPENPAVFRHLNFQHLLGGHFTARCAIFEDCKFRKGGAWFVHNFSTKWEFEKCIIRGSAAFTKITHVDYGIKFTDCTLGGVNFEEIREPTPKDKPLDWMSVLRKDWRIIERCRFEDCTIPPTIFWCATESNYARCKFQTGAAFESDTPTDVVAYVVDTVGDSPDKVLAANPAKRAALRIRYTSQPFGVFVFPGSK
jgi:TolB-like protein